MKKLTSAEFHDRTQAVLRAAKIFEPVTKNITIAFQIYQEVLAEQERKLKLVLERERDYGILGNKVRPICPDCGEGLGLLSIKTKQGRKNVNGYKSCWVCPDDKCCYEEYSTNTLQDWLKILENKEGG